MAAASTRFATPSLPRMFETWTLAVLRVMNRASAICSIRAAGRDEPDHLGLPLCQAEVGAWFVVGPQVRGAQRDPRMACEALDLRRSGSAPRRSVDACAARSAAAAIPRSPWDASSDSADRNRA